VKLALKPFKNWKNIQFISFRINLLLNNCNSFWDL